MRFLIVHQYFLDKNDSGGSRMNQLTKILSSRGHKVTVIAGGVNYATGNPYSYMNGKKWVRRTINENSDLIRVKVSSKYNKNFFGRIKAYIDFTYRSTIRALSLEKPDLILTTSPPLFVGTIGKFVSTFKHSKWVFEVRDLWPEFAVTTGVIKNKMLIKWAYKYERSIYKKCDALVVLTPAFEKDVKARYDFLKNKVSVFTNAADFEYVFPDKNLRELKRKEFNFEDKKVFMYTGAHGLANGLDQVIEAAKLLRNRKDIIFALVGAGMMKNKLLEKSQKESLNNLIFFPPVPKEKINEYLNAADVCMSILMPNESFKKVYPNKVFDYMACEKPVLNNIQGQTAELISKSRCGYNVMPGRPKLLAESVLKMIEDPRLEELGDNGYTYVKQNFDRMKVMNNYADFLENLVSV